MATAALTTTVFFFSHPGPSGQWADILDDSFAPYSLVCSSNVENKFSKEQLAHRITYPTDKPFYELSADEQNAAATSLLKQIPGTFQIITDVGHQFAEAVLTAANLERPRATRTFVWWDNPHGKGIHPYCEEALKAAKIADSVLFASNALTSADFEEPLAKPYTSIGYFPIEQADAWRTLRNDPSAFTAFRNEFATAHKINPKMRIVAIIGGADASWDAALPLIIEYIKGHPTPDTAYVLCSHPRRKDADTSAWKLHTSVWSSDKVLPIADLIIYASTTMAFTTAAAGIPAIQIGPKPENDLLTTSWKVYPSVTNESEWKEAIDTRRDMSEKAKIVRQHLYNPGWKSKLQSVLRA